MDLLYAALEPVWREFLSLHDFLREGASDEEATRRVSEFWDLWHRLSTSYAMRNYELR